MRIMASTLSYFIAIQETTSVTNSQAFYAEALPVKDTVFPLYQNPKPQKTDQCIIYFPKHHTNAEKGMIRIIT